MFESKIRANRWTNVYMIGALHFVMSYALDDYFCKKISSLKHIVFGQMLLLNVLLVLISRSEDKPGDAG